MGDIKATAVEAFDQAIQRVERCAQTCHREIDQAMTLATDELRTREAAIASLSGLIERCKHVLVKDVGIGPNEPIALSEIHLRLGRYCEVQFVDYQGDRARAPHLLTNDQSAKAKTYRVWLCIEELP